MYNTIYPNYVRPYTGLNNGQIKKKTDDEKNAQSSQQAENNNPHQVENNTQQESKGRSLLTNSYYPTGEKVAIDYTKQQIGIEQVLKDFRNTTNAIGAPANVKEEVEQYLKIIENQAQKVAPNPQAIQSNLKNASKLLDEYITNTLKKPSKVVENWVDALFLQQINYKAQQPIQEEIVEEIPQTEILPTEIVEVTEPSEEAVVITLEPKNENGVYVPSDAMLKRLFVQAKKYGAINEKEKALYAFQTAMDYAKEIGDDQTCAMIHFEEGRIYDNFNDLSDALYNYDKAIKQTKDNNLKARASLSMGKIYDDYIKFEPAVDHYCAAVAYAGEADNLPLQSRVLSNLAQLHSERYDKKNTFMFMNLSDIVADETKNDKIIGAISYRNADSCERLNETAKALKYYGKSAQAYANTDNKEALAKDYKAAADIMLKYGNKAKAKSLLSKAFVAVHACGNDRLKQEITNSLYSLS